MATVLKNQIDKSLVWERKQYSQIRKFSDRVFGNWHHRNANGRKTSLKLYYISRWTKDEKPYSYLSKEGSILDNSQISQ